MDTLGNGIECGFELNRDFTGACLNEAVQFSRDEIAPNLQDTAMKQEIAMDAGTAARILIQATDIIQTISPLLSENDSTPPNSITPDTLGIA